MALQNNSFVRYPPLLPVPIMASSSPLLLDASTEKATFIIQAPKAGNIHKIHFLTGVVTTGDTLKVSLQDPGTGDGNPDGLIDQSGTVVVASSDDNVWKSVTLGTDRTVARGVRLAVVIEFNAFVAGNMRIQQGASANQSFMLPYCALFSGGIWTKNGGAPVVVLEYSDGSFAPCPGVLVGNWTMLDVSTNLSPDERALRVQLPFPVRVAGIAFYGRLTANTNVVLYTGTTVLESVLLDQDVKIGDDFDIWGMFQTSVDVAANTVVRASVQPTTTNPISIYEGTVLDQSHWGAMPGGSEMFFSGRDNLGAWTDTVTKRPSIGLILEGFADDAPVGSLLRHPGMSGGMAA